MNRIRGSSMFVKLLTAFVVIIVLAITTAAWQAIRVGRDTIETMVLDDLDARAEVLNHDVEHYFSDRVHEIEAWAELAVMDDLLIGDRNLRIENFLIRMRDQHPRRYESIAVLGPDEVVVASTVLSDIGRTVRMDGFEPTENHGTPLRVSTFRMASEDEVSAVPLAHPVRSRLHSDPIGWLVVDVMWAPIDRVVAESQGARGDATRFLAIVDGTGRMVGGDRTIFRSKGITDESEGWQVPDRSIEPFLVGWSDPIDHGPAAGLSTVALRGTRDAYAPLRRFILSVVGSAALGILLSGVAAFVLGQTYARRIKKLAEGTARIAEGDLAHRVVDRNKDELGQLAASFNSMAVRLTGERGRTREEGERWRTLAEYAPDIILRVGPEEEVEFINRVLPGYVIDDIIGTSVYRWVQADYHGPLRTILTAALNHGEAGTLEVEGVGPRGDSAWYNIRVGPIRNKGRVVAVNLIATDITGKKRMEREILEVSEKERERMGRDLHDGLGQVLTGVSLLSRGLENKLGAQDIDEAADAHRIDSLVQDAIEQTRQLARGFFPIGIAQAGLRVALDDLATTVSSNSDVHCRVEGTPPDCCDGDRRAMHLYRIVQEAVNNAVKHGHADNIVIRLFTDRAGCDLVVEDDGAGIESPARHVNGMGLRLMQYRARMVGALLEVRRGDAGGTVLTCRFPPEVIDP